MKLKYLLLTLFIGLNSYPLLTQAQESKLDPKLVKWTSLHYKTYILFFSVNVKYKLNQISQADSKSALLKPTKGTGTMPTMDPTYRIDLDSKIMGRKSFISLWFDPSGTAFQRTQTDTGSKQRVKTYRILTDGYYSREAKPKGNEEDLPPNKWTQIGEGAKTFNKLPPEGRIVAEPTALYYLVSASSISKPGDKFEEYIFTKHGVFSLKLHAVDYKDIETNYKSNQDGKKQSIQGESKTLHITMNAVAIDPADAGDFDFLGLKGDIDLYMDPATRVLVQVSGKADYIGRTDIKLKEVSF